MKVVLFCGGLGTRLRDHSTDVPKPMVKIGYRPILWHVMKYYAHFGHTDFVLCLGNKADVIKHFFLNYEEWISNDFTLSRGGKEISLERNDIEDWNITFVDTGLHANIGQRLMAVRRYVEDDEMFLANYSDGLTDMDLNAMISTFQATDNVAAFVAAPPSQSFHLVDMQPNGAVTSIRSVQDTEMLINCGFFALRREIFDYMDPGDELVLAPFSRLIAEGKLLAHRADRFWCMDTFKEQQQLTDMFNAGKPPWAVWDRLGDRPSGALALPAQSSPRRPRIDGVLTAVP